MTDYPSRKDYLSGKVTYAEFYRSIYKALGISMVKSSLMPRVRTCLEHGDEHLNDIPLKTWDFLGCHHKTNSGSHGVFKAHGDCMSLQGLVSAYKTAARDAAEEA